MVYLDYLAISSLLYLDYNDNSYQFHGLSGLFRISFIVIFGFMINHTNPMVYLDYLEHLLLLYLDYYDNSYQSHGLSGYI